MLKINMVPVGMLGTACYILREGDREDCVVIDPGADPELIRRELNGKRVAAILLTHGHFDHIGGVAGLMGPDTQLMIHEADAPMLRDTHLNACWMVDELITAPEATRLLKEGDRIDAAGLRLTVLHTPGHTPGSVCYLCGEHLFTGDTVIGSGWGRTDLPGGSEADMMRSLRRVLPYRSTHRLHGGHV